MHHPDPAEPQGPKRTQRLRRALWLALPLLGLAGAGLWLQHRHAPPEPPAVAAPARPQATAPRWQPLADFRGEQPSPDARLLANWVVGTHDNHRHAFILVDKKEARAYVFTPAGRLEDSAPVLLGETRGDAVLPGVGDKPLPQITDDEKTTPAGRFVAEAGENADHEDVIWVDYDDAISMHRVRTGVPNERRLERLASLTIDDNRISFGCINLPVSFYEDVAKPAVIRWGAIIYVLPEVKTVQQVFGAYDVTDPAQVAAAQQAKLAQGASQRRPAA